MIENKLTELTLWGGLLDAEQPEWRKSWAEVAQLLGHVRSRITETTLKGTLTDKHTSRFTR
jgi:hypothetical protein